MRNKILFLILGIIISLSRSVLVSDVAQDDTTHVKTVVWVGTTIGAGVIAVIYAPVVIPIMIAGTKGAATIIATKAIAAGGAIKSGCLVAGPVAMKINTVIAVGKAGKELVYLNSEGQLQATLKENQTEFVKAKLDFKQCMNKQNVDAMHFVDIPDACKEAGIILALLVEEQKLNNKLGC